MLAFLECCSHRLFPWFEAEYLDERARWFAEEESSVDDFGVVEEQHSAMREQLGQVEEPRFGYLSLLVDEQFGLVALVEREFCYAVVGERVVVVGYGYVARIIGHCGVCV